MAAHVVIHGVPTVPGVIVRPIALHALACIAAVLVNFGYQVRITFVEISVALHWECPLFHLLFSVL